MHFSKSGTANSKGGRAPHCSDKKRPGRSRRKPPRKELPRKELPRKELPRKEPGQKKARSDDLAFLLEQ